MIGTTQAIRNVRPISENVRDEKRLEPYLKEVELSDIINGIGAKLYKAVEAATTDETIVGFTVVNCDGKTITFTDSEADILLNGGYYNDDSYYCKGLLDAIGHLSYAQMLSNQKLNTTAFGVVEKRSTLSDKAPNDDVFLARNVSKKIGKESLINCVDYLIFKDAIVTNRKRIKNTRFGSIGQ